MGLDPRAINEDRQTPMQAKQVRLLCPHCSGTLYVTLDYPVTPERRQKAISAAIGEHRGLCAEAPPEAQRVYRIDYPRG